jgi:hypothetical protein
VPEGVFVALDDRFETSDVFDVDAILIVFVLSLTRFV